MSNQECDKDYFKNGTQIGIISGGTVFLEGIRDEAMRHAKYQFNIDWHYFGGRGVFLAVGDVDKAKIALRGALPQVLDI